MRPPAERPAQQPLRIGHERREAASAALGDHYAQGRLTLEEYHERHDIVWAARLESDLWPAFADLPGSEQFAPPRTAWTSGWPPPQWRGRGGPAGIAGRVGTATNSWPPLLKVIAILALVALVVANFHFVVLAGIVWLLLHRSGRTSPTFGAR